ncbi:hypothetical protein K7X08_003325 [Anisodus acutangulus]|uniref:Uncharacterized protein n=1 Tax=Anisodus acutangulus TaxID=402998 RepID=A0A9Q1MF47_9SOLA|nr:hypothetical protein K7X08_003325 [Anisodus acutangulus]
MPHFLPHWISPPNKLVVLNQTYLNLPTTSSEGRKWGDDEEEEVADNEESLVKLNQTCVELPTLSSERRNWGDDCNGDEAESDEDGYARLTMDFREPRSSAGSIDSNTLIVRLDASVMHPKALRMLGFTTKEGLDYEHMAEGLTKMFTEPSEDGIAPQVTVATRMQPGKTQEMHTQVSSSSSFTTRDTVTTQVWQVSTATSRRQIPQRQAKKIVEMPTPTLPTVTADSTASEASPRRSKRAERAFRRKQYLRSLKE